MALSKLQFNSFNVTPSAGKGIRFNSGANGFETASAGGNVALIKTTTLGSAATSISFVDGASSVVLDSTYKEYIFYFNNIHPASNNVDWTFNVSIDTGSNYNVAKTTTAFQAAHAEDNGVANLEYKPTMDLANGTGYQIIGNEVNNANDSSTAGILHLFEPSSTTFAKSFIYTGNVSFTGRSVNVFHAGYANTTSAVDAIDFKFSSGNVDAGTISLYGVT